jgi:hypothetical protein
MADCQKIEPKQVSEVNKSLTKQLYLKILVNLNSFKAETKHLY